MENEIFLRQMLRIYRNAVVDFIRARLTDRYGGSASAELGGLFAKKDTITGQTQWQKMRSNAERARYAPEVSTGVADDFELLGVGEFFPIFEKFFDSLFPNLSSMDPIEKGERRNGILRCLRQIKVFRDPNAHEVTEDINRDAITLSTANAVIVLGAIGAESEALRLRELLREHVVAKPELNSLLISASDSGAELARVFLRDLRSRGVISEHLPLNHEPLSAEQKKQIERHFNLVPIAAGSPAELSFLKSSISFALTRGKRIIPLVGQEMSSTELENHFGPARSLAVTYHAEYAREAAERICARFEVRPTVIIRAPTVTVPIAEALTDGKFGIKLVGSLQTPGWKSVWLVSPFATDIKEWRVTRSALSLILARTRQEGTAVSVITRPPNEPEDPEQKRLFLDQLERDDIEVLLNEDLHAKIYLFEGAAQKYRWYVGSHNLTTAAITRWREVSMAGFREAEFRAAKSAMDQIRRHRDTTPYHIWKARMARTSRGLQ